MSRGVVVKSFDNFSSFHSINNGTHIFGGVKAEVALEPVDEVTLGLLAPR